MFRNGMLTLEPLRDAEQRGTPSERIGKVLVEREVFTPREFWNG
jgi:hypothetical protein